MPYIELGEGVHRGQPHFLEEFDATTAGCSLRAGWKLSESELVVRADRLGFIPIYYWTDARRIVVASSLLEIARRLPKRRFDDEAVSTFLSLGYYLGNSTILEGVRILMPGEILRWNGRLSREAQPYPTPRPFQGTRADAIREFQSRFANAIAIRAPLGVGHLPLSGGRDSRHILLELVGQGYSPPRVITLWSAETTDAEAARCVAEHVGVPCDVVPWRGRLASEYEKNRLNQYSSDENGWYLSIMPYLKGTVFDGLAGDALANGSYFNEVTARYLQDGRLEDAARRYLRGMEYRSYLKPWLRERWHPDMARKALEREFAHHVGVADPCKSFLFWNKVRREIAFLPIAMAGKENPVCLPYQDVDLHEFLLSLPFESFGPPGFHDQVLAASYPDAKHLSFSKKENKGGRRRAFLWHSRRVARMAKPLFNPFTQWQRISAYAIESVLSGGVRPLEAPFTKVMPLMQAFEELDLEI